MRVASSRSDPQLLILPAGGENFLQARNEVRSFEFEC